MKTQFTERTHSTTLRVRPEFIEGQSDVNCMSEFDPALISLTTLGY